ncbi:hypothetical protein KFL_003940090 [Klebsormidium nitens]|uniref:BTB domain-containing protein n=1 Tax=Klebsormidium nitens TaxID=105231 RepID=A0A1Y1IIM8_KLENI|nr:hypothetical protein KFL_003940090 [Klebsormidium nitens]|eukprot:GAQ88018.1 hypothetical protein KFL_003940090 [Klebsormidium nitens]
MASWGKDKPVYPYRTATSTRTLKKRKRTTNSTSSKEDLNAGRVCQKVTHCFKIDLEKPSPDGPLNNEYELDVPRGTPGCSAAPCGYAYTTGNEVREKAGRPGDLPVHPGWWRDVGATVDERIVSDDGGPDFHCKVTSIEVRPNANTQEDSDGSEEESEDSDSEEDRDAEYLCTSDDDQPDRSSSQLASKMTVTVSMKRIFTERWWNAFKRSKELKPQSALLGEAEASGDVYFVTQDGATVAAHSAALLSVPYFSTRLKQVWEGQPRGPGHKLKVDVPCPAGKSALEAFLYYVYGDRRPLYRITPTRAARLQELLKLADACDVPQLCSDIDTFAVVTKENARSWLSWLRGMHGSNLKVKFIRSAMVEKLKEGFIEEIKWERLTNDQLAEVTALQDGLKEERSK